MIEEQTEPILFYEYAKKHVDIDIETILDERNLSRNTLRSLQPFCVALPKNHPVLKSVQLNKEIMNGIGVYFGPYCERTGLSS
ncbi:hypothetical protein [Geomicrobium sp. JCM 19038]|uniref:hypothetical protein n=1 Tax=Geomicrobium sp. JCM 19038 TaxID=1460635 RepID=UPI0005AA7442|nr:hypothetical protein [Geomicrobium sp. JCM 19038]